LSKPPKLRVSSRSKLALDMDANANTIVALVGVVGSIASSVGTYFIFSRRSHTRVELEAIKRGGPEAARVAARATTSLPLNPGKLSPDATVELAKQEIENRDRRDRRVLVLSLSLTFTFAITTVVCLAIVSRSHEPVQQTDTAAARDSRSEIPATSPPAALQPEPLPPRTGDVPSTHAPPQPAVPSPRKKVDPLQHDEVLQKLRTKLRRCSRLESEEVRSHCEKIAQKSIQERLASLAAEHAM
jgi:hypothetical protein